jgi:hypothetical protein
VRSSAIEVERANVTGLPDHLVGKDLNIADNRRQPVIADLQKIVVISKLFVAVYALSSDIKTWQQRVFIRKQTLLNLVSNTC